MESSDKVKHCRNTIIAFILNNVENKLPIKEQDIQEILDKDKLLFKQCFPLAKAALQQTYGILLKKLPEGRKYICCSELPAGSTLEYDEEQKRQLTLLFVILSYIYLKNCRVEEQQLFDFLHGLKIDVDAEHPYFGANLKKLITDTFVKQLYLKKEQAVGDISTDSKHLYSWGFRSTVEFNEKDLLLENAKILKKDVNEFVAQANRLSQGQPADSVNVG